MKIALLKGHLDSILRATSTNIAKNKLYNIVACIKVHNMYTL